MSWKWGESLGECRVWSAEIFDRIDIEEILAVTEKMSVVIKLVSLVKDDNKS